jgi:hypothetical protein
MKEKQTPNPDYSIDEESVLINTVVNQVQAEIGRDIMIDPKMSVSEIKSQATRRFIDLVEKGLLSEQEANKCYRRFARMVDWYYNAE